MLQPSPVRELPTRRGTSRRGRRAGSPGMMKDMKLFRLFGGRHRGWPAGPTPTVRPDGPPRFHCPKCRRPVADDEVDCAGCGTRLIVDY